MGTKAPDSALARLGGLLATPLGRVLRTALLCVVAFLAVSLVVRQARAAVHRMPAYRLGPDAVRFVDLPAIVDERMRADAVRWLPVLWPAPAGRRPCVFEAGLERRLKDVLTAHPMVREVRDVEVRWPADVRVRADLRTPIAVFRARTGVRRDGSSSWTDVPVDPEGVVLDPDTYGPFLKQVRAVLVTGVDALSPGVGRRWTDTKEQVAEGLAAARVANRLNADLSSLVGPKVEVLDVSGFPAPPRFRARGEVVLRLSDGRRVQWGRTERAVGDVVREDGFDVKRARLMELLAERGPGDRRDLDVRFPAGRRGSDRRGGS